MTERIGGHPAADRIRSPYETSRESATQPPRPAMAGPTKKRLSTATVAHVRE
jgi:hypothetical protein